jgi:hypothetical protein
MRLIDKPEQPAADFARAHAARLRDDRPGAKARRFGACYCQAA